jgi:hypothetical protein
VARAAGERYRTAIAARDVEPLDDTLVRHPNDRKPFQNFLKRIQFYLDAEGDTAEPEKRAGRLH